MVSQSQIAEVTEHFDRAYRTWHDVYQQRQAEGYLLQTRLARAIELVQRHAPGPGRALDLGCGCGPASLALAGMGHTVLGVDVSTAMVEQASREASRAGLADRCRFQCADVGVMDLEAGSFDIIVALGFIEYFDEPKALLSRMRQWLAPTGILVLQISNRLRLTYLLDGRSRQTVQKNGAGLLSRQYSPGEIAVAAGACGLRRVDYRGHSIGPLKIGGHFLPGYRAAVWLDRRMDQIANLRCCRALGRLGTSFISVFRRIPS